MILANTLGLTAEAVIAAPVKVRRASQGNDLLILSDIYKEEVNIVTWQRDLSPSLQKYVSHFLTSNPTFQTAMTLSPYSASSRIIEALGTDEQSELVENITELVDMFCCLFDLSRVGLRLTALDHAMCPKFHVDKVPCRLVTNFHGIATEWLPHQIADRTKLGAGSNGLPDNESGIYHQEGDIQQLEVGDVALLKGESWHGNENAGLVHRSPALSDGNNRLLLTLDFAD